jgi:hypothetical protein
MTGRTMGWVGMALVLALGVGCSKGDDAKKAVKKFHSDFVILHEDGVRKGFFGCLYGDVSLPSDAGAFIDTIKRRFDSDPEGFITEKSEGCKAALEQTIEKIRGLVAPTAELGSARDQYTDAATAMIDGWAKVHKAFLDYKQVEDTRIEFNGTYAPLMEKAGNQGWALLQKCSKDEKAEDCLARIGATDAELKNAYRYLNFVVCILKAYDVDPNLLLVEDLTAVDEGRAYLKGVKLLRDKLNELCTGEYGQPTNILEWGTRISSACYATLEAPEPAKPELFEKMMTWWSSDGTRDASGEAFSSYAVLADVCVKQAIDLEPPLREFLKTYGAFVTAASALEQALQAAAK